MATGRRLPEIERAMEWMSWCERWRYSVPEKTVFQWLFDDTFGGSEQRNAEMMPRFLAREYPRNEVDTPTVVERRVLSTSGWRDASLETIRAKIWSTRCNRRHIPWHRQ